MRHDWECQDCKAVTEVERKMSESSLPPRHSCKGCGADNYKKKLALPMRCTSRSEKSPFPMRLSSIEKIKTIKDSKGKELGKEREKIIATSETHYHQILNERGMVMALAGEDSTIGKSQRSVYDTFLDNAAPSETARDMAKKSHFVEDPAEVGQLV